MHMRAEWTSVLEAADGVQVAFSLAVYVSQLAIEACVTVLSYQVPNETMSPTALLRPQRVNTKPDFIDRVERVAEASDGNFLGWAGDGTFTSDFQDDSSKASETFVVLTMDYSQNLTLPNAASTPSQWYFLSLVSISVFGVFDFGLSEQTNFVYSEKIGGKGSNEVISMLKKYFHKNSILDGNKSLALYANNCGGQNKNNYVIKFLLMATFTGRFSQLDYNFFVKGHTKNACDRGFGHTRKKFLKTDCWTFDQVVEVVQSSSSSNKCMSLENDDTPFFDYKSVVDELFSNVQGSDPGVVECRRHPHDVPKRFDLRCTYDGIVVGSDRARVLWEQVQAIDRPRFNPEKARDLYKKIRPYVPQEFRNCGYYDKPTEVVTEAAKRVKRARAQQQKRKRLDDELST
ncbi:hypothetical protein AeRB84_003609 [Aphanomyces euteiches]|nr:hypothetical protein AeRB84_003609 [Aphanomyces euteiches]